MTDDNTPTADLTDRELLRAILRRLEALEAKAGAPKRTAKKAKKGVAK